MKRVTFLIDGFNIYHSVLQLKRDTGYSTKWLDLYSLCTSYLPMFGRDARLASVHYFSALPHYLSAKDPGKVTRHQAYLSCLRSTGVIVELGRFKEKEVYCTKCRTVFLKHEEKETDVSMAVKLLELFHRGACDTAVIVSGDTDLSPAVPTCKDLFPGKTVVFAFPYARKNKELANLAPGSFSISKKQYIRYQFPNPVILAGGKKIPKPSAW